MYLKALELRGFKSFPEKTVLSFDKPVTAIVGPNGSGKSNIADALQWVMGEQSTKALRGGKMEDVIFGGTEKRGQVGYAEVTLTLDNKDRRLPGDMDQVEVTRRYYRSGESEYFINKKLVRLKDINELFMDTGLGREGYSIIGQGKIDAILSAKSMDRREIFEEAAGISRYRHRKEEAERKLEHAEDDLLRIGDKISELELQVEPLRKQSETARRYLILRDELRGLEISLWLTELEEIVGRTEKLQRDQISANAEVERAKNELEKLYDAGESFSQRIQEKDVETETAREFATKIELQITETESAVAVIKANLEHRQENIQRVNDELRRKDGQSAGIQGQIKDHQQRLSQIEMESVQVRKEYQSLRERTENLTRSEGTAESSLTELMRRVSDLTESLSKQRAICSSAAATLEEVAARETSLAAELDNELSNLSEMEEGLKENEKALSAAHERTEEQRNIVRGYELRMDRQKRTAEESAGERTKLQMELGAVRSRRQLLRDMEREYEGYSKAVKTVMKEAGRGTLQGVRGPAGELLKSPARYAIAVETAMGAAMQNIIVESESVGKTAINLLKRQNAGRVTLLPMSVIRGNRLNERELQGEEGFEGLAYDLVAFDKQYQDIYMSLLGRTVVVEELDSAVRIAKKYGHRFRIVTLDGQVLNAGGSMTGGSASRGTGILSRANELKELTERETSLTTELENAEKRQREAARFLAAAEYDVKRAMEELRTASEEEVKLQAENGHRKVLKDSLAVRLEQLREEIAQTGIRRIQAEERRKEAESAVSTLEVQVRESTEAVNQQTGDKDRLQKLRQSLLEEEAVLRERSASLEAERSIQGSAIEELLKLQQDLSSDREGEKQTLQELGECCEALTREIEEKKRVAKDLKERLKAHKERISTLLESRMVMEAERNKSNKATQDKNRELLELERESGRVEQRFQAAQMEEKQIIDKLWDSYGLSRSAAMEQRRVLPSIPAAKRRTGELKKEMSSLGTPNLGAIEEFERVNTRYTYLTGQRDDIEKSKKELCVLIGDITHQMEGIFQTEFNRIGESFKQVFLELFGGGKAAIEMEDPAAPLESGIEIRVQPPGKAVKTLTLLSGGEKAFVAIALYYAILRIRPTPFVVMDEIEAALDEANVIKVSEYMRKLADKTQFLVITHRRGTMEEADVLYGVTMQERGVSRVLSIDLEEAERTLGEEK